MRSNLEAGGFGEVETDVTERAVTAVIRETLELDRFSNLPASLKAKILSYLPIEQVFRARFFSKSFYALRESPDYLNALFQVFSCQVAYGEQDFAEKMLKAYPRLALCKGQVTDLSGRTFKEITIFQYALWALDWHMWTMILNYLPSQDAAQQFKEWKQLGTEHGAHADWRPLIKALDSHVELVNRWWEVDQKLPVDQRKYYKDKDDFVAKNEAHWCKTVGGHQRNLPAHVVNEYCRLDRSFYPTPKFDEATLPRTRITSGGEWFTAVSRGGGTLGRKWAAIRAGSNLVHPEDAYVATLRIPFIEFIGPDADSLRGLYSKRIEQLEQLEASLAESHPNMNFSVGL